MPLSSHRPPAPAILDGGRPQNPLLTPERRAADEAESLRLVSEIVAVAKSHGGPGADGAEVFADAAAYRDRDGNERTALNPASMSPERLALTVRDLRARLVDEQRASEARRVKAVTLQRDQQRRSGA